MTPNGHSVGSVTAGDSIGQNAVATATPASTIQVYTVVNDRLACTHTRTHAGLSPHLLVHMNTCMHTHTHAYAHMPTSLKHTHTHLSLPEGSTSC